ncbi:MAG: hypothetical protein GPJ25_10230 [Microcystis aeruginosa LE13-04]|jgi:hypothetical protein|nr:hypothetical protein [Microcystis aeruginosa LE13-04]
MKRTKTSETFFMLTPDVRDRLLTAKLTAAEWRVWCYLASLDPFGDRGAKFIPAELMLACSIGKSSYFAIKAKFQKLGLFDFKEGLSRVFNLQRNSRTLESNSGILESNSGILESNSGILESKSPKPLQDKDSETPKTIQTIQTLQTVEEADEVDFISEPTVEAEPPNIDSTKLSPSNISKDILGHLKRLKIPIDKKIQEAIDKYGESRAWEVIYHIEATKETIRSKYGVFLYQISKQPEEKPTKQLSSEFLEWYQYARIEIAEDIPPELLPLDHHGEPLIRMRSRPGELIAWQRAKSGENFTRLSGEYLRAALEKIAPNFANKLRKGGKK